MTAGHVFALELHSADPDRLAAFYRAELGIEFRTTDYPCRRHIATVGPVALVITDAQGHHAASDPGRVTLCMLAEGDPGGRTNYRLPPAPRPLGGAFPEQEAHRRQDPDGNYVATAAVMTDVLALPARNPTAALVAALKDFTAAVTQRAQLAVRDTVGELVDRGEYFTQRVAYLSRDLAGYTHLVTSRQGLFAVNETSYKHVLRGRFYGLTLKDDAIYCFQACGDELDNHGRILRLDVARGRITSVEVIASGFDDGCHQMDFLGDDLLITDCYNGRILQLTPGAPGAAPTIWHPLGVLPRKHAKRRHINSIAAHPDGTIWILLHNSGRIPSEVVVLDRQFTELRRFPVDGGAAHGIVFTGDAAEYLVADSLGGRIVSAQGPVIDGMMMTRGISLDDETCVVGDSHYATRAFRRYVPGRVVFFDRRTWSRRAVLAVPGAPTEIRRIDGRDLSLSNFALAKLKAPYQVHHE
jgi:hypothetical protein